MSETISPSLPSSGGNEQTEVGNYFISNYPPYSFWSPEKVQQAHQVLAGERPDDYPLGIYFHIPFCRKRCHFCYFRVYTDKNAAEIRAYIDAGIREIEMYGSMPYLAGRRPKFIYFGGGTPSYLSVSQLEDLTDRMKAVFPWDDAEEVAFECEPGTLTEKKLDQIRSLGVTRLSLGVENFDDHILELNGRAHRSGEIDRAYSHARSIGFPQINIDLIAGMIDETDENWDRCVEKAIGLEPDCVTIYQMEIPYNTGIYKEMQKSGKVSAPVADWPTKRRWVSEAFDAFVSAGYTVTSAYTVVKDPDKTKFVYRDALWGGADMIGAGVASFGHLGGVHVQNEHDIGAYLNRVTDSELPIYRAYGIDDEESLIREFILQLKIGRADMNYFNDKFNADVSALFSRPISQLQDEGFLKFDGSEIVMTRDGLLQVDRLLHEFFLNDHQNARYA
ncbi:MAG: coproporphyrinogen III oxidase family protein [Verrucomicrobiales bacterium]|nr:coproporphyrinogen III oxidase family protein [Verrucomicrobiales bacterium]